MPKIMITGSCGLVGSELVVHFHERGWRVVGIDNNMRREFFGASGDVAWNRQRLLASYPTYVHYDLDIRERDAIDHLVSELRPDLIVHAAAQPSHDLAASRPFDDFEVNAVGTLNLLEAVRHHKPDAVFVHLSTNKVYGDRPNRIALKELETRWDYADPAYADGIDESMSLDQSTHSLFGVSKVAADLLVQEYGRYFGIPTCCLRGGCLTGPNHAGVELHGFLSYLVRCNLEKQQYTIYGYKGKQVRDNIHSRDIATCVEQFYGAPVFGAVYNLGGGRANSVSILEAFDRVEQLTGIPMRYRYVDQPRVGDHMCYISNLTALKRQLPDWDVTYSIETIFDEIVSGWRARLKS